MRSRFGRISVVVCSSVLLAGGTGWADEPASTPPADSKSRSDGEWTPAVEPRPLSEHVEKGLAWLVAHQQESGGWGQGEESVHMGRGVELADKPNVADTCAAILALHRAGSTPSKGPHAENIRRGLDFICAEIAKAEPEGLHITELRGTRLQSKLGHYVDTFFAALVLGEAKDDMPDEKGRRMVIDALDKVMDKIEKNQQDDGSWGNQGWASVLAEGVAAKAINRVAQKGYQVDKDVLAKAERRSTSRVVAGDAGKADVTLGGDSAGVELYAYGATLGAIQESANTNSERVDALRSIATTAPSSEAREEATAQLQRIEQTKEDLGRAKEAVISRMDNERFIAGFGSNGGEEFLSYMNIGESLVLEGGDAWTKWNTSMTENLNRIQNEDGSWSGHHCITGKSFCTSTALMVLTTDRAKFPLSVQMKRR